MRQLMKIVGGLGVVVLASGGAYLVYHWEVLSTFPGMPSSYDAKEYCSCRWVSGRDDGFCDRYVAQSTVPTQGRQVDEPGKSVTSRALWVSNTARWVDPRRGCVLDR